MTPRPLKIAVVGDRNFDNIKYGHLLRDSVGVLLGVIQCDNILTGDATGVDAWARLYATFNGFDLTVYCASADRYALLKSEGYDCIAVSDWKRNGRAAGPMRNGVLIKDATHVILVDGGGPGSADIAEKCRSRISPEHFVHLMLDDCPCVNEREPCVSCGGSRIVVKLDGVPFANADWSFWR